MSDKFFGLYRAIVRNNIDPEQRYRLQVDAPSLSTAPLSWAEACISSTQPSSPNIGDSIWVMFEAGDLNYPVWVGVGLGHAA